MDCCSEFTKKKKEKKGVEAMICLSGLIGFAGKLMCYIKKIPYR